MDWASVIGYQEREFLFVSFGCIALSARAQVKLWCRIKNAFLTGDFLYTGKNEVSDNFPRKIHHNKFYFCTCSMHDSFIGISPWKKMKMMFYTSDKLTNVLECVMFVSQFHVHCKIGTLIHRITFDSISNANSCQMIAKSTRKLSRVFYSSLSTKDYSKTM